MSQSTCKPCSQMRIPGQLADPSSCGRPYVLRDATSPFSSLTLSDRATNLEDIERRLKLDILDEARRYGGMVLFHDEVAPGELVPTWQAVDETSVKTPKEVYDEIRRQGWRVDYWRIPIAPDRPIEASRSRDREKSG